MQASAGESDQGFEAGFRFFVARGESAKALEFAEAALDTILADMETSEISIFAVQVQPDELRSRIQMTDVVNRRRMRNAHMINITPEIMCQGMCADFALVDRLSQEVLGLGFNIWLESEADEEQIMQNGRFLIPA